MNKKIVITISVVGGLLFLFLIWLILPKYACSSDKKCTKQFIGKYYSKVCFRKCEDENNQNTNKSEKFEQKNQQKNEPNVKYIVIKNEDKPQPTLQENEQICNGCDCDRYGL
jgi:hypothetical protein